ncbi:hypothetical protein EYF80_051115 [Liparis tanakae]|uniref:Uncharacterized protein n=1 Tax=Liparis tanakae TaxID=230148 RepID=A0A4Z2FD79_9TELE|nr:hypothetical protein EYF80_051115 [Liparis tanakae]
MYISSQVDVVEVPDVQVDVVEVPDMQVDVVEVPDVQVDVVEVPTVQVDVVRCAPPAPPWRLVRAGASDLDRHRLTNWFSDHMTLARRPPSRDRTSTRVYLPGRAGGAGRVTHLVSERADGARRGVPVQKQLGLEGLQVGQVDRRTRSHWGDKDRMIYTHTHNIIRTRSLGNPEENGRSDGGGDADGYHGDEALAAAAAGERTREGVLPAADDGITGRRSPVRGLRGVSP